MRKQRYVLNLLPSALPIFLTTGSETVYKILVYGLNLQAISSPWDVCLGRSVDRNEDQVENLLLVAMAGSHQIWGVFLTDGLWLKGG